MTPALGLHARPAARFVGAVSEFDAQVEVSNATRSRGPADARSLTGIATLGVRQGDEIVVRASGEQAAAVLDALRALAADNFGDPPDTAGGAARTRRVGRQARRPTPSARGERGGGDDRGAAAARRRPTSRTARRPRPGRRGAPPCPLPAPGCAGSPPRPASPSAPPAGCTRRSRPSTPSPRARPVRSGRGWTPRATPCGRTSRPPRRASPRVPGGAEAEIFTAHALLLDDTALTGPAHDRVARGESAGRAWQAAGQEAAAAFRALDDPVLKERAVDVEDVARRVLARLAGTPAGAAIAGPGIVVAGELTPGEAAGLDPEDAWAIATARGGATAHAAILARALGIPAVVGLGEALAAVARGHDARARRRGRHRRGRPRRRRRRPSRPSAATPPRPSARRCSPAPPSRDSWPTAAASRCSRTSAAPRRRARRSSRAPRASACCARSSSSSTAPSRRTRTSRSPCCARSPPRWRGARSSCGRSTPAPTSRCPSCVRSPRTTRSSAAAGSASRSPGPTCSGRSCGRSCASPPSIRSP